MDAIDDELLKINPASQSSEKPHDGKAASHRTEAEQHRKHDVADGKRRFAIPDQRQRLQTEGRHRGVATEKPGYREQPRGRSCEQRTTVGRKRAEDADQERPGDVDDHRAPRKGFAEAPRHHTRDEISRGTAERAANDNADQCANHVRKYLHGLSSPAFRYRPESMTADLPRLPRIASRPASDSSANARPARNVPAGPYASHSAPAMM